MKNKKKYVCGSLTVILGILLLSGCRLEKDNKLVITTSLYPMTYIAEELAGEHATIEQLYPERADIHEYEISSKEMLSVAKSDIVFYVSDELETTLGKSKETNKQAHYVEASNAVNLKEASGDAHDHDHEHEGEDSNTHEEESYDPHVWQDPQNMKKMAYVLYKELKKEDPKHTKAYKENYEEFSHKMDDLDGQIRTILKDGGGPVIVNHQSYAYFGAMYNVEFEALHGLSTHDEPTTEEIQEYIKEIKKESLTVVFVDQNASRKLMEQIRKETGVSIEVLHNLETLTPEDKKEKRTYIDIMLENSKKIQKSFEHESSK